MYVAITGTPGTGKSTVCKILKSRYEVIDPTKFSTRGYDRKRKAKIIDIDKLGEHLISHRKEYQIAIIEGHYTHLLPVDCIIILRCHPTELKRRLESVGYGEQKIRENVEAECVDVILIESLESKCSKIYEIDTTNKLPVEIANDIYCIIESGFKKFKKYEVGKVDWSSEILKLY